MAYELAGRMEEALAIDRELSSGGSAGSGSCFRLASSMLDRGRREVRARSNTTTLRFGWNAEQG
jgi:hypothetical protein